MAEEISLDNKMEKEEIEEGKGLLGNLEEKISYFLKKYQELKKERDQLAMALDEERKKSLLLEKKMEALSMDREKVKMRIDQLLHRLKGIDL